MHVHSGLPIIEHGVLPEVSFDQDLGAYGQIEDGVRHQSNTVHIPYPYGFDTSHNGASHQSVDVAVGGNDKSGTHRGNDSVFELVGKVGRVNRLSVRVPRMFPCIADSSSPLTSIDR